MDWPPYSPDLAPCVCFLWDPWKQIVFRNNPDSNFSLQQACHKFVMTRVQVCHKFVMTRVQACNLNFGVSSGSVEGTQSPLHQQKSNHVPFSSRFSSPRKRSESCSSNVPESYLPYSPKVSNTDAYPDTAYTCNEINNLDYGMPSVNRNNGTEQIEDDRSRDILNIPLNRPSDKLYFYSDLHSNQKIHYSYGRGISAYTEQLYFSRAGLVIDSPDKSHLLSQMNYLEKLSDFSVGGPTFNHLNGSIYP
ncbi:hypothetical protein AVEN_196800-1, partial [Araneus ventricosus]